MIGPYSLDLRRRIVAAYQNGEGSIRELAERFSVAPNTVQNYLRQVRTSGPSSFTWRDTRPYTSSAVTS